MLPRRSYWVIDEHADYVQMPSMCPTAEGLGSLAQPASCGDIIQDAGQFALSFARDFRALHQLTAEMAEARAKEAERREEGQLRRQRPGQGLF